MMHTMQIYAVTPDRWDDLVRLFGPRGAYGNCWCMWWRLTSREFDEGVRGRNREAMGRIVAEGREPGLLAYEGGRPVGWVSVAPRDEFGRLERSRTLRRVDDEPVWSIVCFFIDRPARGRGVGVALLRAAVEHAGSRGARFVEAYPVAASARVPAAAAYTGVEAMFQGAGFERVLDAGKRVVMRRRVLS